MQIKTRMNPRFKMTDLGKLSWFLGIQFECQNNTIKTNQSRHMCNILTNKREITSDATGVTAPTTSGGFGQ